ncbi:MAG: hypothetical protein WA947_20980 [Phormidesmis sp.]
MPKPSRLPLKPNPFVSWRDPMTGKWKVVITFPLDCFQQSLSGNPSGQQSGT